MGGSSSKVNDVVKPEDPDLEEDEVIKPVESDDEGPEDTLEHQFLSWSWFI